MKLTKQYVIVRCEASGVHAGILETRNGREVELSNTRRIWYWSGAASLSELAAKGPADKSGCKFPAAIDSILLLDALEIIPCSDAARIAIESVPQWSAYAKD